MNVDGSEQDTNTHDSEEDELEEDEFDDVVDRFESSYNFRFEEPWVPHPPCVIVGVDHWRFVVEMGQWLKLIHEVYRRW